MAYPLKRGHRAKMDQWAKGLRLSMFCQCPRCRTLRALSCSDPQHAGYTSGLFNYFGAYARSAFGSTFMDCVD